MDVMLRDFWWSAGRRAATALVWQLARLVVELWWRARRQPSGDAASPAL